MRTRDWKAWDAAYLISLGERAQAEIDAVVEAVAGFVARKTKTELYSAALERSLLLAPLMDAADLRRDDQLAARAFFTPAHEPRLGREVIRCGPFARLSATPLGRPPSAPHLGEGGVTACGAWSAPRSRRGRGGRPARCGACESSISPGSSPGPSPGRLLAEFGADVIRVESARRLDPGRTLPAVGGGQGRTQPQPDVRQRKCGQALGDPRPRATGSPSARPPPRGRRRRRHRVVHAGHHGALGTGLRSVRALKPDIIYLSTCQQGQTGPHASYRGYGSLAAALAGFYTVTGWPDREPSIVYGAYTDFIAHHFASAAVLAALDHRARTGEGQHIDIAQRETGLHFLAPEILESTVNGRVPGRRGNAVDHAAPHNAYPCAGRDRWCVIACETEQEWRALVGLMGEPDWSRDPRYAALGGRKAARGRAGPARRGLDVDAGGPCTHGRLQGRVCPPGSSSRAPICTAIPRSERGRGSSGWSTPRWGGHLTRAGRFAWPDAPPELRRGPASASTRIRCLPKRWGSPRDEIARLRAAGVLA